MSTTKMHIRHVLLYEFDQGRKASEAQRNITKVYGDDAVSKTTCNEWFRRFKKGDKSLEDKHRSGRPKKLKEAQVNALLKKDNSQSCLSLSRRLKVAPATVFRHLKKRKMVKKVGLGCHTSSKKFTKLAE